MDIRDMFQEHIKNEQNKNKLNSEERKYKWNCLIFEIATNWKNIQKLIENRNNGNLRKIYKFEQQWLNFLDKNNIDILEFDKNNSEEFVDKYLK